MKRNLLAIAIPALLVAGAANASIEIWNKDGNKLNVNGRVYALNYIGEKAKNGNDEGDKTTARLGFTGETQVTDSLSGYGRAEFEYNTDGVKEVRYAFAGLNFGQVGSLDYGKNDGVLKAITGYTDVLPEFGGDSTSYVVLGKRTSGVLTYRNSDFFGVVEGLSFAAQYADSNSAKVAEELSSDKEAYGLNAQYAILDTGLTVGAGYAQTAGDDKAKSYIAGINYDANNLYLGAIYNHSKQDEKKIRGVEFVAQYGIDFEVGRLTPSLAYVQHKDKSSGTNRDLAKYVEVGMQYDFNKNLTAIVDYKINLLKESKSPSDYKDTLALGLIYQF
ncbi:porin OmpF [Orbus sasakiae]|uniref:Porin OmpF n=1 Tax=Orbus sasakiae TaxID=1078475 RepID=A0ABP9NBX8_9GAMM